MCSPIPFMFMFVNSFSIIAHMIINGRIPFLTFIPFLLIIAVVSGCSCNDDDGFVLDGDVLEMVPRLKSDFRDKEPKSLKSMKPDDVILSVNGYPLTKSHYDEWMKLKARYLMKKASNNANVAAKQLEQAQKLFIDEFINQRLLLDNARQLSVTSVSNVNNEIMLDLAKAAKEGKKTKKQVLAEFPGDSRYLIYQVAEKKWLDALIKQKIPPKFIVDDQFLADAQAEISKTNEIAANTNAVRKAILAGWRREIIGGKTDFATVANERSEDYDKDLPIDDSVQKGGYWGIFERGDIDDKAIQAAIFSLKQGEISDVLEDEDNLYLVKVLKVLPPEKNEKGRVIRDETRELARILLEKEPLIIRLDDDALRDDLSMQAQIQAINDYVDNLRTNGTNRIEFPHGEKLFSD